MARCSMSRAKACPENGTSGSYSLRQIRRDIHDVGPIIRRPADPRIQVGPFMLDVQALGVGVEDQVPEIQFRDFRAFDLPMQLPFQKGHLPLLPRRVRGRIRTYGPYTSWT